MGSRGGGHDWEEGAVARYNVLFPPPPALRSLQEMVDLSAANVTGLGAQSAKRSSQWLAHLEKLLNAVAPSPDDAYECVGTRFLVGVLICVFVKVRHRPHVSNVQDAVAPVGIMGVMGNKGGAAVRLRIYDSSMCFVCAHLAAHQVRSASRRGLCAPT